MKFSWEDLIYRSYTHSTSEPSALPLRVTVVGRFTLCLEHLVLFCYSCYLDSICFYIIVHAIRIASTFIFVVRAIEIASKKDFQLEVFFFLYLIISTTVVLILVCRQISGISSELVLLFQPRLVSGGFHLEG